MAGEMNTKMLQEMNDLLDEMNKRIVANTKAMQSQLDMTQEMVDLIKSLELEDATDQATEMAEALDEVAKNLGEVGGESSKMEEVVDAMDQATTETGKLSQAFNTASQDVSSLRTVGVGAMSGFTEGIAMTVSGARSLTKVLLSAAAGGWAVAKSILAIPFRILDALVAKAQSGGGGNELAAAYENVRKEFGSFKEAVSSQVIESAKSMQGELANTGLSVWRVAGNLAERLDLIREVATKMGPTFNVLGAEFAENAEVMIAYQKGLGISSEAMKGVGTMAIQTGMKLTEVTRQITNFSVQMSAGFGLSQKQVSRDVSSMMNDMKNFGSLTVKQMVTSAIYVRKLGVEFKDILGTVDKFDTFADAAENASKLAQAFGMNIDAVKMMQEQDLAKRVEELRKSFFAAGNDASTMSRQQVKLLASTAGISEDVARSVFSLQNQGAAYDQIAGEANKAEKSQLTQAEAMSKLSDSIERLTKSGGGGFKSFFDAFLQGFERGVTNSKEFIKIMYNVRQSLLIVFRGGMEVGRMFVEMFADVKGTFGGIADLLSPARFTKLMSGVTGAFRTLFQGLKAGDPKEAVGGFFEGLKGAFRNAFGGGGDVLKSIGESMMKFGEALSHIVAGLLPKVAQGIADLITGIVGFIKDPTGADGLQNGAQSTMQRLFGPLVPAIKEAWTTLEPAFKELFDVVAEKIKDYMKSEGGQKFMTGIATALLGPTVISTAFGAVKGVAVSAISRAVTDAIFGPSTGAVEKLAQKASPQIASKLGGPLTNAFKVAGPVVAIGALGVGISDGLEQFGDKITGGVDQIENKIGAASAGMGKQLSFGLISDETLTEFGNGAAKASTQIFDKVSEIFGPGFSDNLKNIVGGQIDLLGALGDTIKAMMSGDSTQIADAIMELAPKLITAVIDMMIFAFAELPAKIVTTALSFQATLAGTVMEVIGKIFQSGEDIPVIGGLLGLIGDVFVFVGGMFKDVGKWIGDLKNYINPVFDKIYYFVNNFSDIVKDAFNKAWNYVKDAAEFIWTYLKVAYNKIQDGIQKAKNFIYEKIEEIVSRFNKIKDEIVNAFSGIWTRIKNVFNGAADWIEENVINPILGKFDNIKAQFRDKFKDFSDVIEDVFSAQKMEELFDKMIQGIHKAFKKLKDGAGKLFTDFIEICKKAWDIKSPSRVFMKIGGQVAEGLLIGLDSIPEDMGNLAKTSIASFNKPLLDGSRAVQDKWGTQISDAVAADMDEVKRIVENIDVAAIKPVADSLTKIRKGKEELEDEVHKALRDPFKLSTQLRAFGNSQLSGENKLRVERGPVQFNLHIQTHMDANKVADSIVSAPGSPIPSIRK